MDVKIEAAAMTAAAELTETTVVVQATYDNVFSVVMAVASSSCPSLGSHSISAVAPDTNFWEELAVAA